jgi:hypothetical protein
MSTKPGNLVNRRGLIAGLSASGVGAALAMAPTGANAQQSNTGSVAWKGKLGQQMGVSYAEPRPAYSRLHSPSRFATVFLRQYRPMS